MTGKTECCGWDVWAELAGMAPDRRITGAEEWRTQRENQSVPPTRNSDSHYHVSTIHIAHEDR